MTSTLKNTTRVGRALTAALLLMGLGCSAPLEPSSHLPAGATALAAPAEYRTWWAKTEACAQLAGDFDQVHWYVVPGVTTFETDIGEKVGLWSRDGNIVSITVAGDYADTELVVRHEMLHAILNRGGHPEEYFVTRCGLTWESWHS